MVLRRRSSPKRTRPREDWKRRVFSWNISTLEWRRFLSASCHDECARRKERGLSPSTIFSPPSTRSMANGMDEEGSATKRRLSPGQGARGGWKCQNEVMDVFAGADVSRRPPSSPTSTHEIGASTLTKSRLQFINQLNLNTQQMVEQNEM